MPVFKYIFLLMIAVFFTLNVGAQRLTNSKTEAPDIGLFIGVSSYNGDLTFKLLQPKDFHPGIGIYYRVPVSPKVAFRLGFTYGTISGADSLATGNTYRLKRNLNFKSNIYDVHLYGEYSPIRLYKGPHNYFAPYVFIGLGYFRFNPMAEYNGEWYALQPLGTEGQGLAKYPSRKPYKLNGFSIPFGIGVRYKFATHWNVGLELAYNKTYTDFLDDVSGTYIASEDILNGAGPNREVASYLSDRYLKNGKPHPAGTQRGNDGQSDSYIFTGITIGYSFLKSNNCFSF